MMRRVIWNVLMLLLLLKTASFAQPADLDVENGMALTADSGQEQTDQAPLRGKFSAVEIAKVDRLLNLMKTRLALAGQVARIKWNSKAPIEDLLREKKITDEAAKQAPRYRLEPKMAVAFFQGQIDASKTVQRVLHENWTREKQAPFTQVPDLARDIRPALDRLMPELMQDLAEALPVLRHPDAEQLLDARAKVIFAGGGESEPGIREAILPLAGKSRAMTRQK